MDPPKSASSWALPGCSRSHGRPPQASRITPMTAAWLVATPNIARTVSIACRTSLDPAGLQCDGPSSVGMRWLTHPLIWKSSFALVSSIRSKTGPGRAAPFFLPPTLKRSSMHDSRRGRRHCGTGDQPIHRARRANSVHAMPNSRCAATLIAIVSRCLNEGDASTRDSGITTKFITR